MKEDDYIPGENTIKCFLCRFCASPDLSRFNQKIHKHVCVGCDGKLKEQENQNQETNHGIQTGVEVTK